ncbi:MAG: hypothetical protein FWF23_03605 [Alphaproteobacteria bacterium]|nr:hypothetical protein [Alphaproteobacteria bacterium]MCL2505840.1 hypothetical protein [Alphaproteobacteria bacterium]
MKDLTILIKLQKTRVDEQRVILSKLRDNLDKIIETLVSMEEAFLKEQAIAKSDYNSRLTYEKFLEKFLSEKQQTENQKALIEEAVLLAHDKLSELFEEQKRYEIAEEQRLEEARGKEIKLENQITDEIGLVWHQRRNRN